MSVPKSLTVAAAMILGLSTFALPASGARYRNALSYRTHGLQHIKSARPAVGSNGGYSLDPKTRALEILADKYRPREW